MGDPQWSDGSSDRPQWTGLDEPRSWFEKQAQSRPVPDPAAGVPGAGEPWAAAGDGRDWRPVSDLTDTAWGLDGAWRDPAARWNVAGAAAQTGGQQAAPVAGAAGRPGDLQAPVAGAAAQAGALQAPPGWDTGDQHWDLAGGPDDHAGRLPGDSRPDPAAGRDDRADWDRGTDRAGWDRDTAWGAGQTAWTGASTDAAWGAGQSDWTGAPADPAWGAGQSDWTGARADAAWTGVGSPVALLERPQPQPDAPEQDAPAAGRRHAVRHPLRIGLFALVLFGLVAGSVAWLSMDKSVTLTVDGEARAVKTYASTVGGVLDDQNLTVGAHDTLAPARDTRISDGAEIVLRRGRLITLTVDGQTRRVWTTATTVQDALAQIGYRQANLWMSSDRSTRLPLGGYQLTLRTPKSVTIVADGARRTISTTAATVGDALEQAGIDIGADDTLSPLSASPVRAGMTITLTRQTTRTTTTQAVVEYKTVEKTDPSADPGSRTVQTKGVTGLEQVTTVLTYVDGRLTGSKVTRRVLVRKPVDEVVVVGPQPQPSPSSSSSAPPVTQPAGCADFPTTGGLNWCGLAQCESGLNPNAYNPAGPYYGLYQFDVQTWQANGGTGTPSGKSIAEQTRVAYNLYQARGRAPWPVCGKNL